MDKTTRTYNVSKLTTEELNDLIAQHDNEHAKDVGFSKCLCLLDEHETVLEVIYWGQAPKAPESHTPRFRAEGWYKHMNSLEDSLLARGDYA